MAAIGVTGAIASGKTEVAERFASHGAHRIDADALGKEALEDVRVREGLRARFGDTIFDADGSVDRTRLGAIVFRHADAMESLNAVVQPTLLAMVRAALRSARTEAGAVVLDAALLSTWKLEAELDGVVEVMASPELRIERLVSKGLTPEEARARVTGQKLPPVLGARRRWRIVNAGTRAELEARADQVWREIERLRPEPRNG